MQPSPDEPMEWIQVEVHGRVQGVGFRPFIHRLSLSLGLCGWISNEPTGVQLLWGGTSSQLATALRRLQGEHPAQAIIQAIRTVPLPRAPEPPPTHFEIRVSSGNQARFSGGTGLEWPLDTAPCVDCWQEFNDPNNRRFRYPFIACSQCGPRFSVLERLPWDRANTSFRHFPLCAACLSEFSDSTARRFHAEAIGCHQCGPSLFWHDCGNGRSSWGLNASSEAIPEKPSAPLPTLEPGNTPGDGRASLERMELAAQLLDDGGILSVQGIGGFHLMADATNGEAIERLRARKQRPLKPFALMAASLEQIAQYCSIGPLEAQCLQSPANPIVLLALRPSIELPHPGEPGLYPQEPPLATNIAPHLLAPHLLAPHLLAPHLLAPHLLELGWLLPPSPIHGLLAARLGRPLICTSGNLSGEPLCWTPEQARSELRGVADAFLFHNRPIICPLDDAVVRVVAGQVQTLRLGRGTAPFTMSTHGFAADRPALALGSQLKNSVAFHRDTHVVVGPYVGDLASVRALERQEAQVRHLVELTNAEPGLYVVDGHLGHATHQLIPPHGPPPSEASRDGLQETSRPDPPAEMPVYHHAAHARALQLEHNIPTPFLAAIWDGAGDGGDGTLHGGEFLRVDSLQVYPLARIVPFPLPGGEKAMRSPRHCLMGMLYAVGGAEAVLSAAPHCRMDLSQRKLLLSVLQSPSSQLHPMTSSVGRLFDGIAALLQIPHANETQTFEGQAAQYLESYARRYYSNPQLYNHFNHTKPGFLTELSLSEPTLFLDNGLHWLDWRPFVASLLQSHPMEPEQSAFAFHIWLVEGLRRLVMLLGIPRVGLSGGCFQNRLLLELATEMLDRHRTRRWFSQRLPPNDGGIAAGQAFESAILGRNAHNS